MIVLPNSYLERENSLPPKEDVESGMEQVQLKRECRIREDNVFERLSCQNTAALKSLRDHNQKAKRVEEPNGKPRFYNFLSNSSDETASTLSSSVCSFDTPTSLSNKMAHRPPTRRLSYDSHVDSVARKESVSHRLTKESGEIRTSNMKKHPPARPRHHAGSRPSSLPRGPTQSKLSNVNNDDVGSIRPRPPRARSASPFHERLSSQQTKASSQRIQDKPPLHKHHFPVDHVPFIPFVSSSAGSVTGSEVSSITELRFPTPPRTRRNSTRNRGREGRDKGSKKSFAGVHDRLAATETKSLAFKKGLLKEVEQKEQKKKPVRSLRSQDALYYRLSRSDTVASSRRKPSPLRKSALTPYEMDMMRERVMNKKPQSKNKSVYQRLSEQGTMSSIRKMKTDSNQRFNSEYETFGESCKNALMRRFEGSTFVHH